MRLKIAHVTEYHYDQPIQYALQRLRMTPQSGAGQTVEAWQTRFEGAAIEAVYDDAFVNRTHLVSVSAGQQRIRLIAEGVVETADKAGIVGPHAGFAPLWLFRRETGLTRPGRHVRELARRTAGASDLERLHAVMAAIAGAIAYEPGTTHAATPAEDALEAGRGVCQDHAHAFIASARVLGFPARYVSGYLRMDGTDDQAASHAWAEAHVEGLGWVGFDAANGISPDQRYVRVATGLDYRDAAPVTGIRMGISAETLAVAITVEQ